MKRKVQPARRQLALQLIDARLENRAVELDRQIAQPKLEQLFVWQVSPV
jgi:hypothetical protein